MTAALKHLLIICTLAACFYSNAAGEAQLGTVAALQKENVELRSEIIRLSAELALMKQWLAGMVSAEVELGKTDAGNLRLAKLNALQQSGMALVLKSDAVSKMLRAELNAGKFNEAFRIKYSMLLDELDTAARSFAGKAVASQKNDQELQIIAIDRKLQLIVLSGGSAMGITPGMILFPKNFSGGDLRLRVTRVRPGACAADLQSGSWEQVIPGMLLTPVLNRK